MSGDKPDSTEAKPDKVAWQEGYPPKESCPKCGYTTGHAPNCPNR
jgi:hypothetical protein